MSICKTIMAAGLFDEVEAVGAALDAAGAALERGLDRRLLPHE